MNNRIDLRGVEFSRLHDYMGMWAVEETRFWQVFNRVRGMDLREHVTTNQQLQPQASIRADFETIATTSGLSIAVVQAKGTLMKHASSLDDATSTVQLRQQIRSAARSPNVGAILMVVDSPGGTVAGMQELADEIAAASALKPIWAQVEDLCASAAYWAASQCTRIVANGRTAMVGSIGTILGLYDYSRQAQDMGIEALPFVTGSLKATAFPGAEITEEQRVYLQGLVDSIQVSFSQGVRDGRGMTDEQVAELATGGVWLADQALELGLIDGLSEYEQTINELAGMIAHGGEGAAATTRRLNMSKTTSKSATPESPKSTAPKAEDTKPDEETKPQDETKPTDEKPQTEPDRDKSAEKPDETPAPEADAKVSGGADAGVLGQLAAAHERIGELKAKLASMEETAKASAEQVKQLQACVDSLRGEETPAASKDTTTDPGKKTKANNSGVVADSIVIRGR